MQNRTLFYILKRAHCARWIEWFWEKVDGDFGCCASSSPSKNDLIKEKLWEELIQIRSI